MSPAKDSRPDNYEMNAKICRLVEQCPFMYDRSHPQYLRKEICDEAWIRIAKDMGESVFPCRERWRNIRTSFARSINTNKVPSSANRTKPYYLHKELKFLARHITPGVPVRNRKKATSCSGEESEHIEVSVGEETFNGFERLSALGGESTTDTQNGNEIVRWQQRLQQQQHQQQLLATHMNGSESGGAGVDEAGGIEHDSCNSSSLNATDPIRREDEPSCSRFARLPPPPLQAAPHNTLQRGNAETEAAAAALQQTRMTANDGSTACPPLSKRPRKGSELTALDETALIDCARNELNTQRSGSNVDAGFLQELQTELGSMNHRQKIHMKRRIYEALSEIYPLTTNIEKTESSAATEPSQLDLAALLRVENLCRHLKSESDSSAANAAPHVAQLPNGESVESAAVDIATSTQASADEPGMAD